MKNVKKFDTESAYNAFINTDAFVRPNISLCADTYSIVYNKILPAAHDYSLDYFTLEFLEPGTITLENYWDGYSEAAYLYEDGKIYYSLNNGSTWNYFEYDYDLNDGDGAYVPVSVQAGDKLIMKAIRIAWNAAESTAGFKIASTCDFNACGNIMSLIWGDDFIGQTDFKNNYDVPEDGESDARGYMAFSNLFNGNTNLINAENLILPATTLCEDFGSEYEYMFNECTSLLSAPILISPKLSPYAYNNMFNGCSSLTKIICLATDISASDCTTNWVDGVAASGTFTKAASMNNWTTGTSGIPEGWTIQNAA